MDNLIDSVFDDLFESEVNEGEGPNENTGDSEIIMRLPDNFGGTTSQEQELKENEIEIKENEQEDLEASRRAKKEKKKKKKKKGLRVAVSHPNGDLWDPSADNPVDTIKDVLKDCDEDDNGEIDLEEFSDGMLQIDPHMTRNAVKEMYHETTYTHDHELRIEDFLEVLTRRAQPQQRNTPLEVIRNAFRYLFEDVEDIEIDVEASNEDLVLAIILRTLQENDDDENGYVDPPEFSAVIAELGLTLSDETINVIFAHFLKIQMSSLSPRGDGYVPEDAPDDELCIEIFVDQMRPIAHENPTLQVHQVLQQAFGPILSDDRRKSSSRKHKHRRKSTRRISGVEKRRHRSILFKNDVELAMAALTRTLTEVDDDENGWIDIEEFIEALTELKSSLNRNKMQTIFDFVAKPDRGEMKIEDFVNLLLREHRKDSSKSVHSLIDTILEKHHRPTRSSSYFTAPNTRASHFGRSLSVSSMASTDSMASPRESVNFAFDIPPELLATGADALHTLHGILEDLDDDMNGSIDLEEFQAFITEVQLNQRFSSLDIETVFNRMATVPITGDSWELPIIGVNEILKLVFKDHPRDDCVKAIYRLVKRVLRANKRSQQKRISQSYR